MQILIIKKKVFPNGKFAFIYIQQTDEHEEEFSHSVIIRVEYDNKYSSGNLVSVH